MQSQCVFSIINYSCTLMCCFFLIVFSLFVSHMSFKHIQRHWFDAMTSFVSILPNLNWDMNCPFMAYLLMWKSKVQVICLEYNFKVRFISIENANEWYHLLSYQPVYNIPWVD